MALSLVGLLGSGTLSDPAEENMKLITAYLKAVENLDYDAMGEILDDNYPGIGPSRTDSIYKDQAISNWKNNVEHLYEKISYSKSKHFAVKTNEGEWVSNWAGRTIFYKSDKKEISILANNYNKAFSACMEGKGYTVK